MELVNKKYYDGFEGEPEIQFIYKKGHACMCGSAFFMRGRFS